MIEFRAVAPETNPLNACSALLRRAERWAEKNGEPA